MCESRTRTEDSGELIEAVRRKPYSVCSSTRWTPESLLLSPSEEAPMPASPPIDPPCLTPAEMEALRGAGAWYAKYHSRLVAELADDPSAYAEIKREKYLTLVAALRKLGCDMALPDELRGHERPTRRVIADAHGARDAAWSDADRPPGMPSAR